MDSGEGRASDVALLTYRQIECSRCGAARIVAAGVAGGRVDLTAQPYAVSHTSVPVPVWVTVSSQPVETAVTVTV